MNVDKRRPDSREVKAALDRQSRERWFLKGREHWLVFVVVVLMVLWDILWNFEERLKGMIETVAGVLKYGSILFAIVVIPFFVFTGLEVALKRLGNFPRLNAILSACAFAPMAGVMTVLLGGFIWLGVFDWVGIKVDDKSVLKLGLIVTIGWGIWSAWEEWPRGNGRLEDKEALVETTRSSKP